MSVWVNIIDPQDERLLDERYARVVADRPVALPVYVTLPSAVKYPNATAIYNGKPAYSINGAWVRADGSAV